MQDTTVYIHINICARLNGQLACARQLYRQVLLRARISYGNSVCPSVRLSVTTRWYTKPR